MKILIYKIRSSEDVRESCRYVGKTNSLKNRKYQHIYSAKKGKINHLYNWMRKLWEEGKEPIFEIIEECNSNNWKEREKYWISFYGIENLTNNVLGGEGAEYPLKGFERIDTDFNTPEDLINKINEEISLGKIQYTIEKELGLSRGFISRARKHLKFSQDFFYRTL